MARLRQAQTGSGRSGRCRASDGGAGAAVGGMDPGDGRRLLAQLDQIKENVRNAIQNPANEPPRKEQRYG